MITSQVIDDDEIAMLSPFELYFKKSSEDKFILDALFDGTSALDKLKTSISYFTGEEDVQVLHNMKQIVVAQNAIIDNSNFEELRNIVKTMCFKEDIVVEHPPRNMSDRQRDIWEKLQKGRSRGSSSDETYLQDLINYVQMGDGYIPLKEIRGMTMFEFRSICNMIIEKDSYRTALQYKTSFKFDMKDDISHWTTKAKIGK